MSVMANDLTRFANDVFTFAGTCQSLRTAYEDLGSSMDKLQGMWTGEAHDTLMANFQADYRQLEQLVLFLEGTKGALDEALGGYKTCEQNVTAKIDAIRV